MRPDIVYVAPKVPYPPQWGTAIRQLHIMRGYMRLGRVGLVCLVADEAERRAAEQLRELGVDVWPISAETVDGRQVCGPRWRRRLDDVVQLTPATVRYFRSQALDDVVRDLAQTAQVVHVARLHMALSVDWLRGTRGRRPVTILDLDDVETVRESRRLREVGISTGERLFSYFDLARTALYQRRVLNAFDRSLVCSDLDRRRLGHPRVVVVPNGTDVSGAPFAQVDSSRTLMFVGHLAYPPNIRAVTFLVREVLPLVRRAVPDATVSIVGKAPAAEVLALHNGASVTVHADVPDVDPYYAAAALAVVPLRVGGGTRLKILEAFARGRAVVSTALGCEGLGVVDGEHLRVVDGAAAFAQACVDLLVSPVARQELAARARRLVVEQYAWDTIEEKFAIDVAALISGVVGTEGHGDFAAAETRAQ